VSTLTLLDGKSDMLIVTHLHNPV